MLPLGIGWVIVQLHYIELNDAIRQLEDVTKIHQDILRWYVTDRHMQPRYRGDGR